MAQLAEQKRENPAGLRQTALRLEYFTVGYNFLEGIFSVGLGILASSVALIGFGLDSGIEVLSALVLLWRLTRKEESNEHAERLERRAVLFVGLSFMVLAIYIGWQAIEKLLNQAQPEASWAGIALTFTSLLVMPWLAFRKKKVAAQIKSRALAADATETMACVWLSVVTLGGLLLNALFGWWWADPVASLGIVFFLVKEGWEGIQVGTGREELDCCADD